MRPEAAVRPEDRFLNLLTGNNNLIARYEEGGSYPKPRSWANCDELETPYRGKNWYGDPNSSQLAQLSERIVPSLAEINFPPGKLERAVVARARAQRLCLKARAPGTLVRAQPPPPPAHLLRAVSAPRTDLVRHARYSIDAGLRRRP